MAVKLTVTRTHQEIMKRDQLILAERFLIFSPTGGGRTTD